MSGLFSLDAQGNQALQEETRLNPITPEEVKPGFFAGAAGGVLRAPFQAAGALARTAELAASVPVGIVGALLSPQTDVPQKYFETVDPYVKGWVDYVTPSERETGTAARVLGGLTKAGTLLAAGGGNPTLMISSAGAEGAMNLSDQGVSPDVAALGGTLEAGANAIGFKVPFLGKTLPLKVLTGSAGFAGVSAATTEAEHQLLLQNGYANLAAQYDPLNPVDRATDILVGGLFGAVHHYTGATPITSETRDAALTANNARHFQLDTAPGDPADVASSAIHQDTIEQAMGQLLRDEPVTPPEPIQEALFTPRPESPAAPLPPELRALDAERARVPAPAGEPVSPIAANDVHVAQLAPEQQPVIHDIYARAAEAKPSFDTAIADVAREVGGTVKTAELKGTERAVAKIQGDYAGDASRIKDVLRTKIEVKTVADALQAVKDLGQRFEILPGSSRNLLDPALMPRDGYRDIKFNVRTANGAIAEVQLNLGPMIEAKRIGHSLYVERDAIERAATNENRQLTPEEAARVEDLNGLMKALYEPVWNELTSAAKSVGEAGPPLREADVQGNRLGVGPSKATQSSPPLDSGTYATGTPSTLSSVEPAGSLPGSSAESTVSTGEIVPPAEAGARSTGHIGEAPTTSGRSEEPSVTNAMQFVAQNPDFRVATGDINADGSAQTVSAAELMAQAKADILKAESDAKAFDAAINCAAQRGET